MAMMPKRVKHRKSQRGRIRGSATRGNRVVFGEFGLQAAQGGWIKAEATDGGAAFRVFLPDGAGTEAPEAPESTLQITVESLDTEPEDTWEAESASQELAAELRRFAQMESESKRR